RPSGDAGGGSAGGWLAVPARLRQHQWPVDRGGRRRGDAVNGDLHQASAEAATRPGCEDKLELRLWLRLLACTSLIERVLRERLRRDFETTLPRFDVLAQLDRAPEGLSMGELSQHLMVSAGNITGLIERLVQ